MPRPMRPYNAAKQQVPVAELGGLGPDDPHGEQQRPGIMPGTTLRTAFGNFALGPLS